MLGFESRWASMGLMVNGGDHGLFFLISDRQKSNLISVTRVFLGAPFKILNMRHKDILVRITTLLSEDLLHSLENTMKLCFLGNSSFTSF